MSIRASVEYQSERYSVGTCGQVIIVIWHGTPRLADFDQIQGVTTDVLREYPDGVGLLIVIEDGNDKPPAPPERKRNAELVAHFEGKIWAMARVVEGSGLKKSVVRFALSTIDMMSASGSIAERTVDTVPNATGWLAGLRPGVSSRALGLAVEKVRKKS